MALKFSMILQAVDRVSAPAKKVRASVSGIVSGFRKWGQETRRISREIDSGTRSLEHYQRRARRLRQVAIGSIFRGASEQLRRLNSGLRSGIRNLDLMGRAGRGATAGLGWIGGKALGMAKWAAAGAGAFAGFSIFDLFKTGGQFEQYQVMLEGMEGSTTKARKAMRWVQKFAQDTPYELDQVMEAFVALKAYGIDPMNGSLMSLGDGAAGMSKGIDQAVEALADAVTGEYERLKEFGIRASSAGDKVTFTYRKNGKDIQRTVKATGSEIEKTITGIFSDRFGGGMARQSKTLFGIMSNLKDMWSGFLLMIADAGIFDKVKAKLQEWQELLNVMVQDGTFQAWAKAISDRLSEAFDWALKFVSETDWDQVGRDFKTIADALVIAARAIVTMAQWAPKVRFATEFASGPLGWMRFGKDVYDSISAPAGRRSGKKAGVAQPWPATNTGSPPPSLRKPPKPPATGANSSGWFRSPRIAPWRSSEPATRVGGALDVKIKVEGPGSARVERLSSVNRDVPLRASVGKAMGGPE